MKKVPIAKMVDVGWQLLPLIYYVVTDDREPWMLMYFFLGAIQTLSCVLNLAFLKRANRSPVRIVYELLLLAFYAAIFTGVLEKDGRPDFLNEDMFWVFCTAMALLYGAISCHELWKMSRPEVVMQDGDGV